MPRSSPPAETLFKMATRASPLALAQAETAVKALMAASPPDGARAVLAPMTSEGDRHLGPLDAVGGKGLFTRLLDEALVAGSVRFAVHSMKDVPVPLSAGVALAAVLPRGDPSDLLVRRRSARSALRASEGTLLAPLVSLPHGARVGTSAPRRRALLLSSRPDLEVSALRGNVHTRLARLGGPLPGEGKSAYGQDANHAHNVSESTDILDAVVLAAAGLERLGLYSCKNAYEQREHGFQKQEESANSDDWLIEPLFMKAGDGFLPAACQGILGICVAEGDAEAFAWARRAEDPRARTALEAERGVLSALGGDCHTACGAFARAEGDDFLLEAVLADPQGRELERASARSPLISLAAGDARAFGHALGRRLAEAAPHLLPASARKKSAPEGAPRETAPKSAQE